MGDIIFTLTSVSRALCAFDRPPGSTLDSIIQISSRFEQAIVELGTTSERMVTSSTRSATRLIQLVTEWGRGDSVWSEAVRAESEEEFYSILRDGAPRYYILYHRQLEQYAAKFYGVRPQPYESPTFTDLTGPRIAEWKSQATIGDNGGGHRRRSLILWGPTRTGKTVWARSLGTLTLGAPPPHPVSYSTLTLMALTLT